MKLAQLTRAALAVAGAGLITAGPATAASIGGFGARPAHFDPRVPATRAYFIRPLSAGGSFSDAVIAYNSGSAPLQLRVYPVDGLTGATSGVVYGNRGVPLTGAGTWLRLAAPVVTVPAHGSTRVGFTASAPAGARPGVHLAGIALEEAHPTTSSGRFQVTEILRAVIGVEMRVPGAETPQLVLHRISAAAGPGALGGAGFDISLANAGNGLCKPTLALSVAGPRGGGRIVRRLDTILPGDTITYPFPWPHALGAGAYRETVQGDGCGRATVLRATATLGHPERPAGHPAPTPRAGPRVVQVRSAIPWLLIALVGAGGMSLGVLVSRLRRQERRTA